MLSDFSSTTHEWGLSTRLARTIETVDRVRGLSLNLRDTMEVASNDAEHLSPRLYLCDYIHNELTALLTEMDEIQDRVRDLDETSNDDSE